MASPGIGERLAPVAIRCVTSLVSRSRPSAASSLLRLLILVCGAALALGGCATVETRKTLDLSPFKRIYVEHRLSDDRHIDEQIVQELQRLGYEATCGHLTMMPEKMDAILTYEDRWEWDFKTYLIELNVTVRTAHTSKKLADGRYYQPTPRAKPASEVIRDVLTPLFKK